LALIINLLTFALFVFGLVAFIKWLITKAKPNTSGSSTPLAIAKLRYAKGEISKAEFDEIKKTIQ
jgi:putative membrane protein